MKRSIRNFRHLKGVILNFGFLPVAQDTVSYVFMNVFIHTFPIELALYQTAGVGVSLMSQIVMGFH